MPGLKPQNKTHRATSLSVVGSVSLQTVLRALSEAGVDAAGEWVQAEHPGTHQHTDFLQIHVPPQQRNWMNRCARGDDVLR
eukprot:12936300-Prorocentrum_lima.AAC.1